MKNPLELIISRRDEIQAELERVRFIAYQLKDDKKARSENPNAESDVIKEVLEEYNATINILQELNHLKYE